MPLGLWIVFQRCCHYLDVLSEFRAGSMSVSRSTSWKEEFGVTIGPLLLKCHPDNCRDDRVCPGMDLNLNVIHGTDWSIKMTSVKQLFFTKSRKINVLHSSSTGKKYFYVQSSVLSPVTHWADALLACKVQRMILLVVQKNCEAKATAAIQQQSNIYRHDIKLCVVYIYSMCVHMLWRGRESTTELFNFYSRDFNSLHPGHFWKK